ncbi:MAG: M48 family metallopeptidase [Burkholderiales bacterium]|nr:M48 family metallopeptidase [Burkholderiales bacterium]
MGAAIDVEATETGIRVQTNEVDDGTPRWGKITLAKSGWDGSQLRLEWTGSAGVYSLASGDALNNAAIVKLAAGKSTVRPSRPDRATRAWAHALIWFFIGVPVLLVGAIVWQHDRIIAWGVGLITVEHEAKLGEFLFTQQKTGLKLIEGDALAMVRDIGGKLTKDSRHKFQFFVAEDKTVNAFAMPGGYVVVHTGLLELAETPEEVAGVLAHEVQHIEQRHSLRSIAQSLSLSAVVSVFLGDMRGLASLGGDLLQLKFSRDHEIEADREGLKALVAAKINPVGMRDFFAKMAAQSQLNPGFLVTHPPSEERMNDIDRLSKALPATARQVTPLAYDYAAIKAAISRQR